MGIITAYLLLPPGASCLTGDICETELLWTLFILLNPEQVMILNQTLDDFNSAEVKLNYVNVGLHLGLNLPIEA